MILALADVGGEVLAVSQFTLFADARRVAAQFHRRRRASGRRAALRGFLTALQAEGVPVQMGVFGARMQVELINDGPVTILLEA